MSNNNDCPCVYRQHTTYMNTMYLLVLIIIISTMYLFFNILVVLTTFDNKFTCIYTKQMYYKNIYIFIIE